MQDKHIEENNETEKFAEFLVFVQFFLLGIVITILAKNTVNIHLKEKQQYDIFCEKMEENYTLVLPCGAEVDELYPYSVIKWADEININEETKMVYIIDNE